MAEEKMKGKEEKKMANGESAIAAAVHSKSEISNPNHRSVCTSSSSTKKTNTAENGGNNKRKSCKGCLYYSSNFKDNSRNPLCVGLSRSLPNVPRYSTGESKIHTHKEGKSVIEFRYGCVGYSLYKDRKDQISDGQQTATELPACLGLELLVERRVKNADSASAPFHIYNKEEGKGLPQHRSPKSTNATGEEFLSRFARNANIVANGVAKNIHKVGNRIKQRLDDILYPYRRRPK